MTFPAGEMAIIAATQSADDSYQNPELAEVGQESLQALPLANDDIKLNRETETWVGGYVRRRLERGTSRQLNNVRSGINRVREFGAVRAASPSTQIDKKETPELMTSGAAVTDSEPSVNDPTSSQHGVTRPPLNAEFLLGVLLKREDQEIAIGCFIEVYGKKLERLGKRRADLWAWCDVVKTAWAVLKHGLLKMTGFYAAYEWLKHYWN